VCSGSVAEHAAAVFTASAKPICTQTEIWTCLLAGRRQESSARPSPVRADLHAGTNAGRALVVYLLNVVTLRCLIVDDNPEFGERARGLLERQGLTIVGLATSIAEAVRHVDELHPDVALVDVRLGDESGFDLARRLLDGEAHPDLRVILISTYEASEFDDLIEGSPAAGFIAKTDLSADAIRRVLAAAGGDG
jgi:CheY-like chemotaxis protein